MLLLLLFPPLPLDNGIEPFVQFIRTGRDESIDDL